MAKNKNIKVRDLKPKKDAKGGGGGILGQPKGAALGGGALGGGSAAGGGTAAGGSGALGGGTALGGGAI
jgi:hypothetical protein